MKTNSKRSEADWPAPMLMEINHGSGLRLIFAKIAGGQRQIGKPQRAGFTLIEVLVSIALLAVLGTIFVSLLGMTSRMYSRGKLSAEINGEAMAILETMARDLQSAVVRPDFIPVGGSGNTQTLNFVAKISGSVSADVATPSAGPTSMRKLSLVSYRVSSSDPALERVNLPILWNDATSADLIPLGDLSSNPYAVLDQVLSGDDRAQKILNGVMGFSWALIQKSGAVADQLPTDWQSDPPVAFRISLAVADSRALHILEATGREQEVRQIFSQYPTNSGVSPLTGWNQAMAGLNDLPSDVQAGIYFYERVVALPGHR
jgi:prepilin-type N-terminal cleavage/methylation domain-containing protein